MRGDLMQAKTVSEAVTLYQLKQIIMRQSAGVAGSNSTPS